MDSITLKISPIRPTILLNPKFPKSSLFRVTASSNPNFIKTAATAAILLAATSSSALSGRLSPAIAAPIQQSETKTVTVTDTDSVEFSPDTIASLKSLVYQKLEHGQDSEALALVQRLIVYQPFETEWKFLAARILNETGEVTKARKMYDEILKIEPLSFEALFENAVLMDRCGEGGEVIVRLEKALEVATEEKNEKSAREVRLIMAQIKYLQKNVDEALEMYEELIKEDEKDYRPYFCQGVIYSFLERNEEARESFRKYKGLVPGKFDVDAYLQTPLSRLRVGGTEHEEV